MAADVGAHSPGHPDGGVRCLDYLEASVRAGPKRLPGPCGTCVHVSSCEVRRRHHLVWAWSVLTTAAASGGAALTILATAGGHW
jgi:hypothetical protein